MKNRIWIILLIIAILALAVFTLVTRPNAPQPTPGKLQVTASFYPLSFLAQEIGGEQVEVRNITPAGAEPHDYEPTAQDIARMEQSKLVVLNGNGLEAWGANITKNLDLNKTRVVVAGEGLANQQMDEGGRNVTDPHVWLSPPLAKKMANRILDGFVQTDPAHAADYRARAATLTAKLDAVDKDYTAGLKDCREKNFITAHAAFGYLATAYGLTQVPIAGLSPDAEPAPADLASIARFAKDRGIRYIFFESLVSPKLAETIAREVGAKTLVLNPLEGLSGEDLAAGKNYFTEMRQNLANLQTALQCAP